jgi:hypothetical protein
LTFPSVCCSSPFSFFTVLLCLFVGFSITSRFGICHPRLLPFSARVSTLCMLQMAHDDHVRRGNEIVHCCRLGENGVMRESLFYGVAPELTLYASVLAALQQSPATASLLKQEVLLSMQARNRGAGDLQAPAEMAPDVWAEVLALAAHFGCPIAVTLRAADGLVQVQAPCSNTDAQPVHLFYSDGAFDLATPVSTVGHPAGQQETSDAAAVATMLGQTRGILASVLEEANVAAFPGLAEFRLLFEDIQKASLAQTEERLVVFIGETHAGKSTLINQIVGEPVCYNGNAVGETTPCVLKIRRAPLGCVDYSASVRFINIHGFLQMCAQFLALYFPRTDEEPEDIVLRERSELGSMIAQMCGIVVPLQNQNAWLRNFATAIDGCGFFNVPPAASQTLIMRTVQAFTETLRSISVSTVNVGPFPLLTDLLAAISPVTGAAGQVGSGRTAAVFGAFANLRGPLWLYCQDVSVFGPFNTLPRGLVLCDVPGYGDQNAARGAIFKKTLAEAAHVVLCTASDNVLGEQDLRHFLNFSLGSQIGAGRCEASICITKVDRAADALNLIESTTPWNVGDGCSVVQIFGSLLAVRARAVRLGQLRQMAAPEDVEDDVEALAGNLEQLDFHDDNADALSNEIRHDGNATFDRTLETLPILCVDSLLHGQFVRLGHAMADRELTGIPSVIRHIRRAVCLSDEDNDSKLVRSFQSAVRELTAFLHQLVSSPALVQEDSEDDDAQTNSDSVNATSDDTNTGEIPRLTETAIDESVQELRRRLERLLPLSELDEDDLETASSNYRSKHKKYARKVRRMHWRTFEATLRRGGRFISPAVGRVDFNADLEKEVRRSFEDPVDALHRHGNLVCGKGNRVRVRQLLFELRAQLQSAGLAIDRQSLIEFIEDRVQSRMRTVANDLSEAADDIFHDLETAVGRWMADGYAAARRAHAGTGWYDRAIKEFRRARTDVTERVNARFGRAEQSINEAIEDLRAQIVRRWDRFLHRLLDEQIEQMRRNRLHAGASSSASPSPNSSRRSDAVPDPRIARLLAQLNAIAASNNVHFDADPELDATGLPVELLCPILQDLFGDPIRGIREPFLYDRISYAHLIGLGFPDPLTRERDLRSVDDILDPHIVETEWRTLEKIDNWIERTRSGQRFRSSAEYQGYMARRARRDR